MIPKNTSIKLIELVRKLAVNNLSVLMLYSVTLILDGLLIALVATTIAPIADYFLDPRFSDPSSITVGFIAYLGLFNLEPTLVNFLSVFVIANFLKAASAALLHFFGRRLAYLMVHDLSRDGLSKIVSSNLEFFHSYQLGTMQNTLQRESERLGDGILSSLTMTATLMQLCILAYMAWSLSQIMVSVSSLFIILLVLLTKGLNARITHYSSLTMSTGNEVTQSLIETLMGAKIILAFGRGQAMLRRFSQTYERHAHFAVISQTLQNGVPALYQAFGFFAVSLALYLSIGNGENVPTLVAALWTLMRMVPLFSQFLGNIAQIANTLPSFELYSAMINGAAQNSIRPGDLKFSQFRQGIRFEEVYFEYPKRGLALSGINLYIPKGSFTAFVGESGSGKTTTADILLRLLAPKAGMVLVDGVPLNEYEPISFLERVGYVPQESFLFNCSIRDNLLWSVPMASEEELWRALSVANVELFVSGLSLKMDTVVGDRGVALSGGQRQRIALARAVLKKPEILVLDEATSALDSESEGLIMQAIDAISAYTTVLVIAHRISTVARADQVCVFKNGNIVESGTYSQLSSNPDSQFASLIAAQKLG